MYNVLIVEDEILERENTRSSWIWKAGDFKLVGDAGNGEDAWQIILKEPVDIVVTDIRMPFMDGLELCRMISQAKPTIKIIILSGYTEFSYAQQAMKYGVSEYIVKPVKTTDLLDALYKVAAKIEQDSKQVKEIEFYKQKLQNDLTLRRQRFFLDLTSGLVSQDVILNAAKDLEIDLDFKKVCCAIIELHDDKILIQDEEYLLILEAQEAVQEIIQSQSILDFNLSLRQYGLIYKESSLEEINRSVQQIHQRLTSLFQAAQSTFSPVIAIGRVQTGISGVVESFADAQYTLNYKYAFPASQILNFKDSLALNLPRFNLETAILNEKSAIDHLLNHGKKGDAAGVIEQLMARLKTIHKSFMLSQYICIELVTQAKDFIHTLTSEDPDKILANHFSGSESYQPNCVLEWAKDVDHIDRFGSSLRSILEAAIEIRDRQKSYRYSTIVAIAKEYINQHFSDVGLSLADVASHVKITPNYLSSILSQETGESFIEYLTRIRMTKAQELLNTTNMRITDIAFAVGYQDSNYFSKIFRRITGETPRQTRR